MLKNLVGEIELVNYIIVHVQLTLFQPYSVFSIVFVGLAKLLELIIQPRILLTCEWSLLTFYVHLFEDVIHIEFIQFVCVFQHVTFYVKITEV